ncbi:MAG: phosphoethanolamine transferase [Geminicoccaceae bacterium]
MDLSAPTGVIAQGYIVHASIQKHRFNQQIRERFAFGAHRPTSDRPEILVVVIGESARPDRFATNGYHRETTHHLRELDNLISFTNVVTEWPLTQASVPIMLSRATARDMDRALKEKSIVAALGEAGFETHWITVQPFSHYGGFIHVLAGDADKIQYLNRVHDGVLLGALDAILDDAAVGDRKIAIFMHSLGSHQSYINRYPPEFSFFDDSGEGLTYKETLDNAYDNSIRYTDWFLSEIIARLQSAGAIASMLYVSDHGENLLDDEREILGHNFGTKYDFSIPLILWYSDEYFEAHPEKIENALGRVAQKLGTSNIFDSLADIADLRFESFREENSFLSSSFMESPRIVYRQNEDYFFDYDSQEEELLLIRDDAGM